MRITETLNRLLDPTNPVYTVGDDESRKQARDEWHRQRFLGQVMSSNLPEIARSNLTAHPLGGILEDMDGRLYRPRLDGITDLAYADTAAAYYIDANGTPVLLERPPGEQTRAELDERRAAREARRNQPRPKPAWMR